MITNCKFLSSFNYKTPHMKLVLFISLLILACKAQPVQQLLTPQQVSAHIDSIFSESAISGLSILLIKDEKIVYEKNNGFANIQKQIKYTSESIQNIASVSKTIIAVSLMKAVDQGKVDLDTDINTYLPFDVRNPNHPNIPITLRQLATHTSSILDSEDYMRSYYFINGNNLSSDDLTEEYEEYFDLVQGNELIDESEFLKQVLTVDGKWFSDDMYAKEAPGEVGDYSNIGATLAAYVIENAVGMRYEDFTKKYIFDPLEMNDTSWNVETLSKDKFATRYFSKEKAVPDYYLITKADGGLYTTTKDFSKFMIEMIRGFKGEGKLLSAEAYQTMFTPQRTEDDEALGIFWELDPEDRSFQHSGGDPGVTTNVAYSSKKDRAMIIFTNIDANEKTYPQVVNIWNIVKSYDR